MSRAALSREGPWTEEAYLALREGAEPPEGRVELLDDSLVVSPAPGPDHDAPLDRIREAISAAIPERLHLVGPAALRVAPGRILLPDLLVVTSPGDGSRVRDAEEVLQVVEVVPGDRDQGPLVARSLRPRLYAEAGIPYYLRAELHGPALAACLLIGGRYLDHVRAEAGETLRLDDPFPVEIDLAVPAGAPTE